MSGWNFFLLFCLLVYSCGNNAHYTGGSDIHQPSSGNSPEAERIINPLCPCPQDYSSSPGGYFCRKKTSSTPPGNFKVTGMGKRTYTRPPQFKSPFAQRGAYLFSFKPREQNLPLTYNAGGKVIDQDGVEALGSLVPKYFWRGGRFDANSIWPVGGDFNQIYSVGMCFDIIATKKYSIGFSSDDGISLRLNGKRIFQSIFPAPEAPIKFGSKPWQVYQHGPPYSYQKWSVFEMELVKGKHFLSVDFINYAGSAGLAFEIYDNRLDEVRDATGIGDLTVYRNSNELLGRPVLVRDGSTCPTGDLYNACTNKCESWDIQPCLPSNP